MKYTFIQQHFQAFSIQRICVVLGLVRSGYYHAWRQYGGEQSPLRRHQAITGKRVDLAFQQGKERSGAPG